MLVQKKLKCCLHRVATVLFSSVIIVLMNFSQASAHLMVAQRGTLNIVDDSAFMVLSLPVSAFEGVDGDGDGKMSQAEFKQHRQSIITSINTQIVLEDDQGRRPLSGLMLSPVVPHKASEMKSEQLVVMGRFALGSAQTDLLKNLKFQVDLYGKQKAEQTLTISAKKNQRT